MKQYGIRMLSLLLVIVLAGGLVLYLAERPEAAPAQPPELEEAEASSCLMIRSETGRESVSLYSEAWKQLDRLRLSDAGEGSFAQPEAGTYHLIRGDGSTLTFSLDETGLVTVKNGKGWGNGATLELTDELRGSILVRYHTEKAASCRLEGNGTVYNEALTPSGTGNDRMAECRFSGLLPGEYQLFVDEAWIVTVSVKELSMDRIVELY